MAEIFDDKCLFCNIVVGKVPAKVLYEDDNVKAILDIHPANPGHVLLLSKGHYDDLYSLPDFLTGYMFVMAKAIAKVIEQNMGVDGVNILVNQGEAAGQVAKHFMLHIIPRFKDDGVGLRWDPKKVEEADLDKVLESLKKNPIQVEKKEEKIEEVKEEPVEEPNEDTLGESYLTKQLNRGP